MHVKLVLYSCVKTDDRRKAQGIIREEFQLKEVNYWSREVGNSVTWRRGGEKLWGGKGLQSAVVFRKGEEKFLYGSGAVADAWERFQWSKLGQKDASRVLKQVAGQVAGWGDRKMIGKNQIYLTRMWWSWKTCKKKSEEHSGRAADAGFAMFGLDLKIPAQPGCSQK